MLHVNHPLLQFADVTRCWPVCLWQVLQQQVMRAEQSSRRLQTKMLTTPTQTSLTSQPVLLDSLNTLTTPLPPSPIHLRTVSTRYRDSEIHGFHSMLHSIMSSRGAGEPLFHAFLLPCSFTCSLYIFSFAYPFPFYQRSHHSVSRPEIVGGDRTWV